jgi:hypothetical protein
MQLRLAVELAPGDAALGSGGAGLRINMDTLHRRQVDHHPAVEGCSPCHVMTASADRDFEVERAGQAYSVGNIGEATAAGNHCRSLVHQAVVDSPRVLVARIGRLEELPSKRLGKFGDRIG